MLQKSQKFYPVGNRRLSFRAFTLIELLVVIAIIGLIAAIVMVGVSGTRAKARDAKRQTELDQIRKALEMYNISESEYPTTTEWISLEEDDESSGPFSQAMKPDYLSIIPRDPLYPQDGSGQKYSYWYQATTPESYELYAKREQGGFFEISSELGTIAYSAEGPGGRIGKFWVGGTGNWSETNHWSDSWGGPPGATKPTFSDNVYFDENSGGGTVTVNEIANCKDLDFTGYTGTFAGSSALNIYGSLTMASGMTRTYTGAITFATTSTGKTLTFNGKTMASATTFNGVGGGWTLQDAWGNGSSTITLTAGTLNTNGQTVTTTGTFSISGSTTRTLTLGASTINCGTWTATITTNLTFYTNTSVIKITSATTFNGGGKTYNEVQLNSTVHTVAGTNTFATLTRTGTATKTNTVTFSANQTITGTLTLAGNSATNRLFVVSDTLGTARTLTAATVSVSNADFRDITGAGAGSWNLSAITGLSGDCGGNSGITFTSAQNHYWVGNGGSWSSTARWSTSSGGASGAMVPLPQDDCYIDANSISSASQTITADMPRLGKNINWTGVTNTPACSFNTTTSIFGSLTLGTMTIGGSVVTITFEGRTSSTLTSNGLTFNGGITLDAPGGTLTLQDAFVSNGTLTITRGTFDANNQNVTASSLSSSNSNTRTITMGSGTWTLTGSGTVWNLSTVTNLTLNANTSTIKLTNNSTSLKTFYGSTTAKTCYNFWNATQGTGKVLVRGNNIFNDFKIDAGRTQQFYAGNTQVVATFTAIGGVGNLITLESSTTSAFTLTKSGGGIISCDYLSISYSTATPASTWYAGANSTNGGNNSEWTFAAPP